MIRGIRSSVYRSFLRRVTGKFYSTCKLQEGSIELLVPGEETFFMAAAFLTDTRLIIILNQSCYTIHNLRFYSDYKPDVIK